MRLVIYTTSLRERVILEEQFKHMAVRNSSSSTFDNDLIWFNEDDEDENKLLIVSINSASTGWRAPYGTIILFTGSVQDSGQKRQAMARVLDGGLDG